MRRLLPPPGGSMTRWMRIASPATTTSMTTSTMAWRCDHRSMQRETWPDRDGPSSERRRRRIRRMRRQLHRHFSSSSSASKSNDDDGNCDVGDIDIDPGPIRLLDHLDKLRSMPLSDVRNFCIIAHVVSIYDFCYCAFPPRHINREKTKHPPNVDLAGKK